MDLVLIIEKLLGPVEKYGTPKLMMDEALRLGLLTYVEWQKAENALTASGGRIVRPT